MQAVGRGEIGRHGPEDRLGEARQRSFPDDKCVAGPTAFDGEGRLPLEFAQLGLLEEKPELDEADPLVRGSA